MMTMMMKRMMGMMTLGAISPADKTFSPEATAPTKKPNCPTIESNTMMMIIIMVIIIIMMTIIIAIV